MMICAAESNHYANLIQNAPEAKMPLRRPSRAQRAVQFRPRRSILRRHMAPKKLKPGQPTKYSPDHCDTLIAHMEKGYSFESFAGTIGVTRATLYNWADIHPQFMDAKNAGLEKGRLFWERLSILAAAGKLPGFNATAWIFTMKNRFGWRDKIEHSGDEKKPVRIIIEDYGASDSADTETA